MSATVRNHIIMAAVLVVSIGAVIHLGRTEDIGWIVAVVIVATHVGVIGAAWAWGRRVLVKRRDRRSDVGP